MKILSALAFMVLAGVAAQAQEQEDMIRVGKTMAEQMLPLGACLKNQIDNVKPVSNEEAQAIARTACAEVASTVRLNVIEATKAMYNPLPPTIDPEKIADGAVQMVRIHAYWDFTGELKALNERIKKRAEEQLKKR
jgi:hypothetical protein